MFDYGDVPQELTELGGLIIGVAIGVQRDLGSGMLERPYHLALGQRLANLHHHVRSDVVVPVIVEGHDVAKAYTADLIVDDRIVLEIKSVESISVRHIMQLKTYLRFGGYRLGYVLNFGSPRLGIKRVVP